MEEYILNFVATLIEIVFFVLGFFIEKSRIKEIEDGEQAEKELKNAKNIFYIWTDAAIILSTLIMLSLVWVEWQMNLIFCYLTYLLISLIIYILKLKKRKEKIKTKYILKKLSEIILSCILLFFVEYYSSYNYDDPGQLKPIIYIYPETETTVQVSVGHPEKLSCVYPEYSEEGWKVIAKPNGDLVDTKTGRKLYCLYWEGNQKQEYKFEDGFVVAGENSAKFLEEKLAILGLNEREANEFIIYWLPKLEANKYNLIRFETMDEIEEYMPLNIEPKPDSLIRISMNFKGINGPIEIEEQKLETPLREGYTVVEWGGSEF